jgi:hypothetical protein
MRSIVNTAYELVYFGRISRYRSTIGNRRATRKIVDVNAQSGIYITVKLTLIPFIGYLSTFVINYGESDTVNCHS